MSRPLFFRAREVEHKVTYSGIHVILKAGDTPVHRAQDAVTPDNVFEITAVEVLAAKDPCGNRHRFVDRRVDRDVVEERPLESCQVPANVGGDSRRFLDAVPIPVRAVKVREPPLPPSPYRAALAMAASLRPATHTGGWGRWLDEGLRATSFS